jgi:hypothetical protein
MGHEFWLASARDHRFPIGDEIDRRVSHRGIPSQETCPRSDHEDDRRREARGDPGIKSNRGAAGPQRGRRPKSGSLLDVEELLRGENDGHEASHGDAA